MDRVLFVFLGGGLGSVLRYFISKFLQPYSLSFPISTLVVNSIASFLLGILLGYLASYSKESYQYFLFVVGFCGGFSTFSTFAAENYKLLFNQDYIASIFYIIASVVISIFLVFLGYLIGSKELFAKL